MHSRLLESLTTTLEQRSMLKHPFYQAWNEGKLTTEMLREYACQYYHFVKDFPRMVSAVHSNTPDLSVREPLLHNLMDEELGSENHPALWMRFAKSMGATEAEVENTAPLASTEGLVRTMMDYCRNGSFQEGLAALYAYEAQIPGVSRVKIDGLRRFYGVNDPEAIKFFTVHEEADVHHSRAERDLIEANTTAAMYDRVGGAAAGTAEALWRFLDGVQEAFVTPRGVMC